MSIKKDHYLFVLRGIIMCECESCQVKEPNKPIMGAALGVSLSSLSEEAKERFLKMLNQQPEEAAKETTDASTGDYPVDVQKFLLKHKKQNDISVSIPISISGRYITLDLDSLLDSYTGLVDAMIELEKNNEKIKRCIGHLIAQVVIPKTP